MEFGFISLLPPMITILLAIVVKNIHVALLAGVYSAQVILTQGDFFGSIDRCLDAFFRTLEDPTNVMIYCVLPLMGGLILLMKKSGGIAGFTEEIIHRKKIVKTAKDAELFTWLIGCIIFFSEALSALISGAVMKDVNESLGISKEKTAYIIHSTCTTTCLLLPIGGWGAFCIGILGEQGISDPGAVLFQSIPLNFFCLLMVISAPLLALMGKDFGPMKRAAAAASSGSDKKEALTDMGIAEESSHAGNLYLPILLLIVGMMLFTFISGNGDFSQGNGIKALLYALVIDLIVTGLLYSRQKLFTGKEIRSLIVEGAGSMLPICLMLIMAFAFSDLMMELGTAAYIYETMLHTMEPSLFPMTVFVITSLIAITTGSSMGSILIIMPLAMPAAVEFGTSIPLLAGAVWGAGAFGNQTSPIADTTIITCAASGCEVMDHVKTQTPYNVALAVISCLLYMGFGSWML